MKPFAEWLGTGPLAEFTLTERERHIAHVAYNEGVALACDRSRAAMEAILNGQPVPKYERAA